jgi:hypothetical protein
MSAPESYYFHLLKKDIANRLRETFPEIAPEIENWRGQEIWCFQEDLMEKVQSRVSEKWFYTHIKGEQERLPRIDILDLLSQYVGYQNWQAYKAGQSQQIQNRSVHKKVKNPITYISVLVVLGLLLIVYVNLGRTSTYQFCFVNAYSKNPIRNTEIDVILLQQGESPYRMKADESGCIHIHSRKQDIRFVVKGPYYMTDTITRLLNKAQTEEQIALLPNDYALMIHFFSNAQVEDWQKRREQLDRMFDEEAHIYQVFEADAVGMEMYNKQEFIDKLTMPIRSLQNIEVLETIYEKGKIKALRFRQMNEKNDE